VVSGEADNPSMAAYGQVVLDNLRAAAELASTTRWAARSRRKIRSPPYALQSDQSRTASRSPSRPEAPTRAHLWILVIIAGAQLMVVLDSTIMIIALPSAQRSLGFSNVDGSGW